MDGCKKSEEGECRKNDDCCCRPAEGVDSAARIPRPSKPLPRRLSDQVPEFRAITEDDPHVPWQSAAEIYAAPNREPAVR